MEAEYLKRDTAEIVNAVLDEKTKDDIKRYAEKGKESIDKRIKELDGTWDVERALQLNAAIVILAAAALTSSSKKWILLSLGVTVFLAQHALLGSCAPVSIFKMFGMRTRKEIDREKFALKALRGDFNNIRNDIDKVWEAVKDAEISKRPIGFIKSS
jgi:hypothetical protein